ncbi:MAG: hypothetical protein WCS43_08060 [Verrucomicrobiota bacterium]
MNPSQIKNIFWDVDGVLADLAKPETSGRRRTYYANSQENMVPCGFLTFTSKTSHYGSPGPKTWEENEKNPLEKVLAEMAKFICNHYMVAQKRREGYCLT